MNRSIISFLTLCSLLIMVPSLLPNNNYVLSKPDDTISFPSYHLDDPIIILDDVDLEWESSAGTGTEIDPYMFQDLNIDTLAQLGISISGTTKYFLIVNCTIGANLYDILIDNVAPGTALIRNCTLISGWYGVGITNTESATVMDCIVNVSPSSGIYLNNASHTLVYNNRIYTCGKGIYVVDSYSADLFFNEIYDSTYDAGILAENSEDVTIQYNICDRGITNGIFVDNCTDAYIGYNNCSDNTYRGVGIADSNYALVEGNEFHACDLGVIDDNVEDLLTLDIRSNNKIDGVDIFYGENLANLEISSQRPQIILINCTNVQIVSQDNLAQDIYTNVQLEFCDDITVRRCFFESSIIGVVFSNCENIHIYNNSFIDLALSISGLRSNCSYISWNYIQNGLYYGIRIAENSNNFTVTDNLFQDIAWYGVIIDNSQHNVIYHNNFINCGSGSSYGSDSGTNNFWYNETLEEGNYWDNWPGTGTYAIDGTAGAFDLYPLGSVIVIPELGKISSLISLISILSFISVIVLNKRRK